MSDTEPLYTLPTAARFPLFDGTGVTVNTLDRACRAGLLPHVRLGKGRLVTISDLREWRERCRNDGRAPGSGSDPATPSEPPPGGSRTEAHGVARDAALMILKAPSER